MKKKMILTIDTNTVAKAKVYAKNKGKSLSQLVENHLEQMTGELDKSRYSDKLRKIIGSVTFPADFDEKKELASYRDAKYLQLLGDEPQ